MPDDRARFLALGADLGQAWNHADAASETRKRILRAVLPEAAVKLESGRVEMLLHWQGGDHTSLAVRKNRAGGHRRTTDASTGERIRERARLMPDRAIASLLNRAGKRRGKGNTWTEARARAFRTRHGIAVYRAGERAGRGGLTLEEAAAWLPVRKMTILRTSRPSVTSKSVTERFGDRP